MKRTLKLDYKKIKILYSAVLMVEQAKNPDYTRTIRYNNRFLNELQEFIHSSTSYEDQFSLNDEQIAKAADVINKLPYKDEEQKSLWITLMLINKIRYVGE